MPGSTLRVIARIKAKPDKVSEVREVLRGLVEPTRKEVGCLNYELVQNRNDPTDFTFVEEWENDSAFDSHSTTAHIKAAGAKLNEFILEAPDIRVYSVVD